jgi:uncharacterized protein (TIGR02145 family)
MREKCSALYVAVVIAFAILTVTASANPYVCGDADGNGIVNISDAVYLISYIFGGGPEPSPLLAGDADGNEIVNISDAVYLISYIFGGGPAPACPCDAFTDLDGNTYQTVRIGDLCWMAENLKVTHYANDEQIPHVTDGSTWADLSTGAWCEYNNDPANYETYGILYNWYAVNDSRGLAPDGWHVATDDEWKQLEMYLGMSQAEADTDGLRGTDEGGKLKEVGTVHWESPNEGATNESGFTVVPGGYRRPDGSYGALGQYARFWTATESGSTLAWGRGLGYDHKQVYRFFLEKKRGFSIRCVRD